MHFIQPADFLLNIAFIDIFCCVNDFGPWRRSFVLTLSCLIVVVVVLLVIPDFVVDVSHWVCEGVEILWGMLFTHERIVFLLFKSDFDGNSAPMQISLSIKVLYRKKRTLLSYIVDESPILGCLKPSRWNLSEYWKNLKQSILWCLTRQWSDKKLMVIFFPDS